MLLRSFRRSDELIEFIDNLSGGNTRKALELITAFIGSGHVDAEKILNAAGSGSYNIPIHEFTRAVTFGDFEHYDPTASPVVNLFDISSPDGKEHFLLGNILGFIQRSGDIGAEGFVEAAKIYDFCQSLGFVPSQIDFALERARFKNLLETTPRFSAGPPESYRITTAGAYTFKQLPKEFSYVDAMIVDTPIVDTEYRTRIVNVEHIGLRLDRMGLFIKYLDKQYSALKSKPVVFDWPSVSRTIQSTVNHVRQIGRQRQAGRRIARR